jgi:hypothetical protein
MRLRTELRQALENVAHRFRYARLWSGLAICWLTWALIGLGLYVMVLRSGRVLIPGGLLLVLFTVLVLTTALVCVIGALRSVRDLHWVARRIETKHPELGTGLLSAFEEDATSPAGRLGFLQTAVIRLALDHRRVNDWNETVSSRRLRLAQVAHAAALGLLAAVSIALAVQVRSRANDIALNIFRGNSADVQVDPGNTELERGAALLVVARFKGAVPGEASLVVGDDATATVRRGMTRSLEDPTFAGRVESVDADLSYRVEFEGERTETYRVHVFEYPELQRTDAKLVFPSYTSLESKTVEDIRHVTAVEGTELTLLLRLNKEVATAKLVDQDGQAIELSPHEDGNHVYRATWKLTDPRRFRIQLVDKDGRSNKLTPEIVANVTKNQPAVVKMSQPSHDVRVSPVEELKLKAQLEDDFGVVRHGVSYTMAGREPREIVLGAPAPRSRKLSAEHLLDFESFQAAPDQLLTYFFWAEDIGPDGQPRRSSGDMFFAEVRHFEEIFRQGEQPAGGSAQNEDQQGGGNAQQADKLAELQKEIINGTWKLVRRETSANPSAQFVEDSKVLQESQRAAIEQAAQFGERLQDAASKASLEQATVSMKDVEKQLTQAVEGPSIAALRPALVAEQSGYQALLKLRAREFQVIRNNSRQRPSSGGSGASQSQRQLEQLELTNDENRYEEQRTARAQQENRSKREQEQRETRQVLNRLHELAQRQADLNQRVKELQSALEAAKTQEARDEIERQLKRLRDQQQQILRDTDEVRERMEREENRDRMAEARRQMEETREHVRQASEALEEGRLPQAVTEGARAGRQLNDLREQLRKGASDRFTDEMTEMRAQARRLDEDQKKLTEQLDTANRRPQHSLRDTAEREQVNKGLEQQQQRLDQIMDQMRRTVEDAEETEPLLAKGLYDTVRKATEQKIPDALKVARQLVDLGVAEDAAKSSQLAGQGLEQLREGVERAAKSVLGDETAALKRAQSELEDLADQVNREIAQATGQEPPTQPGRNGQNDPNRPRAEGQDSRQNGEQAADPSDNRQPGGQQGQAQEQQQGQPGGRQPDRQRQQAERKNGEAGKREARKGEAPGEQGQQGQQQGQGRQGARQAGSSPSNRSDGGGRQSGIDRLLEGISTGPGGPITGEGFRQWSDRMRDVEELMTDPELRAETARIRDRVRGAREEFKRHSKEPDWTRLKDLVAQPINELRDKIAEEVRRRESPDSLVPIDRDPVPPQFTEGVRRYYERLGSGR